MGSHVLAIGASGDYGTYGTLPPTLRPRTCLYFTSLPAQPRGTERRFCGSWGMHRTVCIRVIALSHQDPSYYPPSVATIMSQNPPVTSSSSGYQLIFDD